ncbi:hypothetical protein BD626DRAFT_488480 [Schizophyllum amplum]|uniref:Translation machinery-associated protein 16 n=1 Tax=Schizophyllum amplum TaxID=97359 RepID=A0A550CKK7_9AGAR|nr:hypothetical protein BD626DRAFT_488480 [Auriculariopsis ampla]
MGSAKTTKAAAAASKKATATPKKEKVFHPNSRKANQIARKALRKGKMGNLVVKRNTKQNSLLDFYTFLYEALPEEGTLELDELHEVVRDGWLTRLDAELEEEQAARRKGRSKSTKEMKLEDLKLQESETYRTGMEVIDLTHARNVELFRKWDQKEVAYTGLLRFVRISSATPDTVILTRQGNHPLLQETPESGMDVDAA